MGYKWVSCSIRSVPANAVTGGRDADGSPIYVGRCHHGGDLLPAKVIPRKGAAYVPYGGKEILVHNVEVLVESSLVWRHASNGQVPFGAVTAGSTSSGETLYVGRANYSGALTVGKLHASHGCVYIPFGGNEVSCRNYEVLCEE